MIAMNTFQNNAEKSTSRLKDVHAEKIGAISQDLNDMDKMKFGFDNSLIYKGKILFTARTSTFAMVTSGYGSEP